MTLDNLSLTTWASIITAIATIGLAFYTMNLVNATQKMIKENSRTVWKNNVIVAVSDYLGFVDALAFCLDFSDFNSRANFEKSRILRTRIRLLVNNESIVQLLTKLEQEVQDLVQSQWSHMKEHQATYSELRNAALQEIMRILEDKEK